MTSVALARSTGKFDDPQRNEDRIYVRHPYYAVIDGTTAKIASVGCSPGQTAAAAIIHALDQLPVAAAARPAVDLLTDAVAAVSDDPATGPSASVLLLSVTRAQVWIVGDGWVMVDGRPVRFDHEIERRNAAARAALLNAELRRTPLADLRREDPGRAMLTPLLRAEGLLANVDDPNPLCYGRLDGRRVPERFVRVIELGPGWREVVLASDGYPRLEATFDESELALAERIAADPLMITDSPATKGVAPGQVSYDDRAWLEVHR